MAKMNALTGDNILLILTSGGSIKKTSSKTNDVIIVGSVQGYNRCRTIQRPTLLQHFV